MRSLHAGLSVYHVIPLLIVPFLVGLLLNYLLETQVFLTRLGTNWSARRCFLGTSMPGHLAGLRPFAGRSGRRCNFCRFSFVALVTGRSPLRRGCRMRLGARPAAFMSP